MTTIHRLDAAATLSDLALRVAPGTNQKKAVPTHRGRFKIAFDPATFNPEHLRIDDPAWTRPTGGAHPL